ncbi:uncharacterized protein PHALS_03636 [Plasmopara halstedii]|uniref:Uncharacterized protein n=1 Tax=Plasmopara halstedii TaxID=4781 RepID=A0A0P1B140_PLAHL|nr:uncharacterized protein PHALS_03636 [Plasmopara halstedii]CEG46968.1 hypothetical protein PHALS_03636 [Plasmopara halstedii]|eukprot:XP_024583337.1 hypothetical protein PHALS_03636 [Plasmopara halstedii]
MDTAVGGIDLRKGCWIHCKWCNSTLKTTPFSLTSWKLHERRKSHIVNGQKSADSWSRPQSTMNSSQASTQGSTLSLSETPKTSLEFHSSQDMNSLTLFRRDFYQNKQKQDRYARDVTNVINAMTSLVSEQHSDIETLNDLVLDMRREIEGLKSQVENLRLKRKQDMAASRKRINKASFHDFNQIASRHVPSVRAQNHKIAYAMNAAPKTNMTDMDIFEKRFRLL